MNLMSLMYNNQEAKSDGGKIRPTLVPTEIIRASDGKGGRVTVWV